MRRLRQRSKAEGGYTLVELLVVILIIGILATVAIPSFLSVIRQSSDAEAKQLARTAQTTAEAYSLNYEGTYEAMTAAALKVYEPSIQTVEVKGKAYLSAVTVQAGALGYKLTVTAPDGHTFSIEKQGIGEVVRTCSGCQNGKW